MARRMRNTRSLADLERRLQALEGGIDSSHVSWLHSGALRSTTERPPGVHGPHA